MKEFRELECDESVVEESVVGERVELEVASVHGAEDGDYGVGGFDGSCWGVREGLEKEVEEGLFVDMRGGEEGVDDLAQGEKEVESGEGEGGEDE